LLIWRDYSCDGLSPNYERVWPTLMGNLASIPLLQTNEEALQLQQKRRAWFKSSRFWVSLRIFVDSKKGDSVLFACLPISPNAIISLMPRKPRASLGGYCYHVLNRGNGRRAVFHKDGDYAAFVKLLRQAGER